MALSELLGRQRRPKIAVLGFDDGEGFFSALRPQASITRPVPELRNQTSWALKLVTFNEAPNLTDRQTETLGDGFLFDLLIDQSLNAFKPIQLAHGDIHPWYSKHRRAPSPVRLETVETGAMANRRGHFYLARGHFYLATTPTLRIIHIMTNRGIRKAQDPCRICRGSVLLAPCR